LLLATVEDLILHEIAILDKEDNGNTHLIFPSQSARVYPHDIPEPDPNTAIWKFEGAIPSIYTMLLVRLWNTGRFRHKDLYENVAIYTTEEGARFRIFLHQKKNGIAELMLFNDPQASGEMRVFMEEYVYAQLQRLTEQGKVRRRRIVVCPNCGEPMDD